MSLRKAVITKVRAREVLDSRGNPTVETEVWAGEAMGRASVPSGASKGEGEALEIRDGDPRRYLGRGVLRAVRNVNEEIGRKVAGSDCHDQRGLDMMMVDLDGTPNKSRLGANAILSVSMAAARASAAAGGVQLYQKLAGPRGSVMPVPMMNVVNGGEHAGNDLRIQEFHVEPTHSKSCSEAIRAGAEVYQSLKAVLIERYGRGAINVGDEGGFAPPLHQTREALQRLTEATKRAGYSESEVRLGIDSAASTFYDQKTSKYALDGDSFDEGRLEDLYVALIDEFGLLTLEDPFWEGSIEGFASLTARVGGKVKVIGDDLYVTSPDRIREGREAKATNAVLIKLNQIGTVTEAEEAIDQTAEAGWDFVVSHRSGETEDNFIAHLAAAFGASFIKTGAPARGERVAKYNELLRIEEQLGPEAKFAGNRFR